MTGPVLWILVHDLDRAGVPLALHRMLGWHHQRAAGEVHVIAGRDGPLRTWLEACTTSVTVLGPATGRDLAGAATASLAQLGHPTAARRLRARTVRTRIRGLPAPHTVLLHGAGAWSLWEAMRGSIPPRARQVLHLHELETGWDRSVPPGARAALVSSVDAVLAVCPEAAALAADAGARAADTVVVPGTTDVIDRAPATRPVVPIERVLGIGSAGWRKGTDRFVAVAHHLDRTRPHVVATWIGDPPGPGWEFAVGARLPVRWERSRATPWPESSGGAMLLVPSREDPLPLVALEAGGRGIPVVAAATGGLPGLLAHDRGTVVAGHDLVAMADAVGDVVDDPRSAAARAQGLWEHVRARYAVDVVGPRWLEAVLGG